jgi:GntR family transcriptional regulator
LSSAESAAGPIYQRIRDALRAKIANGELKEGDRLPSESALVEEFGVARMTVRQALAQLVFENLIVRQPGIGSFVAAKQRVEAAMNAPERSFEELISEQGRSPKLKLLRFERTEASPEALERLQLPDGSEVFSLERLRYVDDQLIGLEIRHFHPEVGERIDLAGIARLSTFTLIEGALGEPIATLDVSMFAASATADIARKLGIRTGAAILVREHVILDSSGRTVLYGNSIYRGNMRFRYVYRRGTEAIGEREGSTRR